MWKYYTKFIIVNAFIFTWENFKIEPSDVKTDFRSACNRHSFARNARVDADLSFSRNRSNRSRRRHFRPFARHRRCRFLPRQRSESTRPIGDVSTPNIWYEQLIKTNLIQFSNWLILINELYIYEDDSLDSTVVFWAHCRISAKTFSDFI